jgi:hypothetical protein
MADDTPNPTQHALALLNAQMDSIAREVGALDPDDAKRANLIKEIFRLSELAAPPQAITKIDARIGRSG